MTKPAKTPSLTARAKARPAKGRPSMFKSDEDLARQVRELTEETFAGMEGE